MKIIKNIFISLFLSAAAFGATANTHTIKNLALWDAWTHNFNASHWIEQANLQVGSQIYGEQNVFVKSLPKELEGADFIATAFGSKKFVKENIAEFELLNSADVYIAHNDAIAQKPEWLRQYVRVGGKLTSTTGVDYSLYKKTFTKGAKVVLGNNGNTHEQMYFVVVKSLTKAEPQQKPQGKIFDITKMGAVGNGKRINTTEIQKAIDECSKNKNGGTVYIAGGIFMTGTLQLKDNVTLFIEAGSILRGSPNPADYVALRCALPSFRGTEDFQLIYAEKKNNIRITGGGIIDGYSVFEGWPWRGRNNEHERPRPIRMVECSNISVDNVSIIRGASWTQYYEACNNLNVINVRVRCYTGTNNQDGIDISGCKNVTLRNFYAITGDDAVCIKALSMTPAENYYIDSVYSPYANCNLLKIGTETHGSLKNVTAKNLAGKTRYAIAIEAVDGSILDGITYENITMEDCGSPLFIRLGNRGRTFEGGPNPSPVAQVRNITIRNVKNIDVHNVDQRQRYPGIGSAIAGIPGHYIENVAIENCDFLYFGDVNDTLVFHQEVPENINKYPDFDLYGVASTYGPLFRHIKNLTLNNVTIKAKHIDARPGIVLDDVVGYKFNNVRVESFDRTYPSPAWDMQKGKVEL